jgi:protocatechuate 3,4-dioxygenase beta subunit
LLERLNHLLVLTDEEVWASVGYPAIYEEPDLVRKRLERSFCRWEPFCSCVGNMCNTAARRLLSKPWSRRHFIAGTIGTAVALQVTLGRTTWPAASPHACALTAEQEEGPYYVDEALLRTDITAGRTGVPLRLRLTVLDVRTCTPVSNAALDIWHCDAMGIYSGYTAMQPREGGPMPFPPPGGGQGRPPGGPPPDGFPPPSDPPRGGPPKMQPTDAQTFLRGVQFTGAKGVVEFATIFPGCYMGRVNHIHLKVHLDGQIAGKKYAGDT